MDLRSYLDRIEYGGELAVDHDTLTALHRHHLLNIPYENFDVMLGIPLDLSVERAYDKLVSRGRGGWCYEMNGLFGWALEQIGFNVMTMAGGVWRSEEERSPFGNHMVLLVDDEWLADVGFGDGLFEPVRLVEGEINQRGFRSHLRTIEEGIWRYDNHQFGGNPGFEFVREPTDARTLIDRCEALQQDDSVFRANTVAQRHFHDRIETLRGSIKSVINPDRVERRLVDSVDEYMGLLGSVFGLDLPEAANLWPLIEERSRAFAVENPGFLTS